MDGRRGGARGPCRRRRGRQGRRGGGGGGGGGGRRERGGGMGVTVGVEVGVAAAAATPWAVVGSPRMVGVHGSRRRRRRPADPRAAVAVVGKGGGGGGERGDVVVSGQSGAPHDRMASISAQSSRGRRNSQRRTGGRRSRGAVETAEACGDGGRRASLAKRRGRGSRARRLAAAGRRPARVGNPHGPPTLRWHATGRDGCRGQLAAHPSSAGCAPAGGHLCRSVSLAAARGSSAGSGNLRRPTPPQK